MPYVWIDDDEVLEDVSTDRLKRELSKRLSPTWSWAPSEVADASELLAEFAANLDMERDPGFTYRAHVAQALRTLAMSLSGKPLPKESRAEQAYRLWQREMRRTVN